MRKPMMFFSLALVLSAACLALAVLSVWFDQGNRAQQARLQEQVTAVQAELQKVSGVERISRNILEDMGNTAASNAEIRVLLARYGYSLSGATNAAKFSVQELEDGLDRVTPVPEVGPGMAIQENQP